MLKFIFWSLLALNAALFAYGRGYLGHFSGNEHEPERLKNQLNADKLAIITEARATASTVQESPQEAPQPKKPEPLACLEVGSFSLAEARRFERQLEDLDLGDRQSRHNLPGTEISSYIVHIPPQGSKEGAEKKAAELRALGITNFYILSDSPTLRWGISLGVFKSETAAQNQLAALMKQGVRTARITPRMSGSKLLMFQFRDVDAGLQARLDKLRAAYPNAQSRACK
ncbi:SPOR domain-containing protein [Oxalobacteraceae bacterium A2-2]